MGIPVIPPLLTLPILYLAQSSNNYLTTLCLNGRLSCIDFMDVIMGDIILVNPGLVKANGTLAPPSGISRHIPRRAG